MKRARLAVLAALPLGSAEGAPKEFRILRAGWNKTEKGDFLFDDESAKDVIAAYTAKGLDKIQIDYEHQSMVAPPAGGSAAKPAAGWFKPEVRGGELWATNVSWTASALAMLAPATGAPEYRYLSPILFFDEDTRRVTRLKNIALTNDPALDELSPLVAATALEDDDMPTECASCASLSSQLKDMQEKCSTLSAQLSAFEKKDKDKDVTMSSLTGARDKVVALTGQSSDAAAIGTIESWKTKAARTDQLEAERATEKDAALTAEMKSVLDAAVAGGKLTPAMRALEERGGLAFGAGKVSKEGVEYLTAKWGAAPRIVNPNGEGDPTAKKTGTATLTSADFSVGKEMGTDMVAFEKYKTEQLEKRARESAAE